MESRRVFLLVLYLVSYSGFSTSDISPKVVNEVEKGFDTSVKLLQCLDSLAKLTEKAEGGSKTMEKIMQVVDKLAQISSSLSFVGSFVGFILAFVPKQNYNLQFMKVQFSEVNRKLDSLKLQMNSLSEKIEWTPYATVYSRDENNIKNSWTKLREFIDSAATAETDREKTRLAERFTAFYENAGTENSVYNFHSYLTMDNPASLNKNLLALVTQKSEGDFKTLVKFTAYFTSLMVTGLQMNQFYYSLKGYDGQLKGEEAVKQLSNVREKIRDALFECADSFAAWAEKDVQQIGMKPLPGKTRLAFVVKEHLDSKFDWYEWTVIVHDKKDGESTYGNSIDVVAQDKVVIHLLHREKGFSVNEGVKAQMEQEWNRKGKLCREKIAYWPNIFQGTLMEHVEYIHEPSDNAQTTNDGLLRLKCSNTVSSAYITFEVYLKSQKLVEHPPCSNVNCNRGECRQIRDTSSGICACERMFYGPTCQGSVQDDIDYAVTESKVIAISYQPVPDLTTIYYDLKDMKRYVVDTLRQEIQWTKIFVKYNDVIEKFRYLEKCHASLKKETMSRDRFVSEVEAHFTGGNTFVYMLHKFDLMMQGTGFGDQRNILDHLRASLADNAGQTPPCSEAYAERVDYFVRMMFSTQKEAVLAWEKYRLIKQGPGEPGEGDASLVRAFKDYTAKQWSLFNGNGCGPLRAELLSNAYCEKPYHSTDRQEVPLTCRDGRRPFPARAECSGGKWSVPPVCYAHPARGSTACRSEGGATVCRASCSRGWTLADGRTGELYHCAAQPCPAFAPRPCDRQTDAACASSEVSRYGECVDGCSLRSCGVNARCSTAGHVPTCSCVSPWILWKDDRPDREGCRYQALQWVPYSSGKTYPNHVVSHVCRASGTDGGWHGGYMNIRRSSPFSPFPASQTCKHRNGGSRSAHSFELLVDPCAETGRSGVEWLPGIRADAVEIGPAVSSPGNSYLVCRLETNGSVGKVLNIGGSPCTTYLRSHHSFNRSPNFHTLVRKRCV